MMRRRAGCGLRIAGRSRLAVAGLVVALTTWLPAHAAKKSEEKPLIGTPQVVKDLHWGDVLFYFYQGDYMEALTRLGAAAPA